MEEGIVPSNLRQMSKVSADEIADMTEKIVDCTSQQVDEIEELQHLNTAISNLSETNRRRKEITATVRRKMMRLHQELG